MTPRASVLINAYNALEFLPRTIDSVYRQTTRDLELILVDDASTDGTREWVRRQRRPGLRYRRLGRRLKSAGARNVALRMARGRFLAVLDADDLWRPEYLARMTAALERGGAAASVCGFDVIDERGRPAAKTRPSRSAVDRLLSRLTGLAASPPPSATVLRAAAVRDVGLMDETLAGVEDSDYWIRLARRYGRESFVRVNRRLMSRRIHPGQQTMSARRGIARILAGWDSGDERDRDYAFASALFLRKHGEALGVPRG